MTHQLGITPDGVKHHLEQLEAFRIASATWVVPTVKFGSKLAPKVITWPGFRSPLVWAMMACAARGAPASAAAARYAVCPVSPVDPTRAIAATVLKHEPSTTVERIGAGPDAIVRKTYRVLGLRWVQSLWRPSRAQREHDHLVAIDRAGVPCLQALRWSAVRRWGGFRSSTLETRFLPDAVPLKQVLQRLPGSGHDRARPQLARAMGELVARLHRAGFLWCTPMPRNVLVLGDPGAALLAVCDTPAVVATGRLLHGSRLARIDLYLGAFSPSRRADWSASERLRWLLGYCAGDRPAARQLWRVMARRGQWQNELERALAMAFLTYVAGWLRLGRPPRG